MQRKYILIVFNGVGVIEASPCPLFADKGLRCLSIYAPLLCAALIERKLVRRNGSFNEESIDDNMMIRKTDRDIPFAALYAQFKNKSVELL